MTRYRFLDAMGDVVGEKEFDDHRSALTAAQRGAEDDGDVHAAETDTDTDEDDAEVQRVEYLGPEGDWRWAGPLEG